MKLAVCSLCSFFIIMANATTIDRMSYNDLISSLNSKLDRIKGAEDRAQQLIQEKNHAPSRARALEIIAELNEAKQMIQRETVEVRDIDAMIRFKFPEKGDEERNRAYQIRNKSFDDLMTREKLFTEKLDDVLADVKKIYGPSKRELERANRQLTERNREQQRGEPRIQPIIVTD